MKEKKYSLIITVDENSREEIEFTKKYIDKSLLLSAFFVNSDKVVLKYNLEVYSYLIDKLSKGDKCKIIEYELINDLNSLTYLTPLSEIDICCTLATKHNLFNSTMLEWLFDYMKNVLNVNIGKIEEIPFLKAIDNFGIKMSVLDWNNFGEKYICNLIDLLKRTYVGVGFEISSKNIKEEYNNPINGMEIPIEKSILINTKRQGEKGTVINNFTLEDCIEKCKEHYKENETFPLQEVIVCFITLFQDMENLLYFRDFDLDYNVFASVTIGKEKLIACVYLDFISKILEVKNEDLMKLLKSI